ncbi:uncharacterized protein LOC125178071 [Hyalella azteca]|uniref:Uncharacterized protein LOC125178071 n=1 Tax=Hyalella azteca TaxID=294128 RepID=A0A979FL71_HYAAZ|nr:uncharacterized protein LOC125178071 [Hyalella azteca]
MVKNSRRLKFIRNFKETKKTIKFRTMGNIGVKDSTNVLDDKNSAIAENNSIAPRTAKPKQACQLCSRVVEDCKRYYGLLPGCEHVFCYICITRWKNRGIMGKNCPVCNRVIMSIVGTPVYFYHNSIEKQNFLLSHLRKSNGHMKKLPNGLTVEQYIKFVVCPVKGAHDFSGTDFELYKPQQSPY